MSKKIIWISLIFVFGLSAIQSQTSVVEDPKFDKRLRQLLNFSVPTISVEELWKIKNKVTILDAREKKEFETSHIEKAKYIGYNKREYSVLREIAYQDTIVLYCSVGYRSEKIGEYLMKKGYKNVFNLYGSIFEWVNRDYPVVSSLGKTHHLHTYNKKWSRWVKNSKIKKTWK